MWTRHKHSRYRYRQSGQSTENADGTDDPDIQIADKIQKTWTRYKHSKRRPRRRNRQPNIGTAL